MRILILGGTGVISREITKQADEQGHDVTLFNRGSKVLDFGKEVRAITGDRHDRADFSAKTKLLKPDVVIDMIAFDKEDAQQTVEAFSGSAQQMIFTSSVAAYARPCRSFPTREDTEEYLNDPDYQYGYNKALMEQRLLSSMGEGSAPITIIRPSLTFGEGCANIGVLRQNANIVHRIKQGKPLVLFGDGTILWSFTFVQDLAKGYLLSCLNPNTYNRCFHVANDELAMWKDLYLTIGTLLNKEVRFAYAPSAVLNAAMPALFNHIEYEKKFCTIYDTSSFKKAAPDFSPVYTLNRGLAGIVDWWESQGNPFDPEKDALEDAICDCYEDYKSAVIKALAPLQ